MKVVSRQLGVKASSVNGAVQALSHKGLVVHEHYGYIELTQQGQQLAQNIQRRHNTLLTFLTDILRIPHHLATQEACALEHHVSSQTLERLSKLIAFAVPEDQDKTSSWLTRFHRLLSSAGAPENTRE